MLKIYGHDPSPFVRRVRILLTELGIPFERDTHGWVDPTPEFLAASPIQRVPMLDRGPGAKTRYVFDSRVIAEVAYDMAGSERSEGAPPLQRTLWDASLEDEDKNVFSILEAATESAINVFLLEKDGVSRDQASYLKRQVKRTEDCLDWLDRRYAGRSTLTEGQLAFVDIALVSAVGWLRFRDRTDVSKRSNLIAVEASHAERPSFEATRPG